MTVSGYATECSDGFVWMGALLMDTCVCEEDFVLTMLAAPSMRVNEMMVQDVHDEVERELGRGFSVEALFDYSRLPEEATHYRFCFMRAGMKEIRSRDPKAVLPEWTGRAEQLWRLKDERTGNLVLVHDYRSKAAVQVVWGDKGSHIFSDAYARVDENGVAWLSEEPFD